MADDGLVSLFFEQAVIPITANANKKYLGASVIRSCTDGVMNRFVRIFCISCILGFIIYMIFQPLRFISMPEA